MFVPRGGGVADRVQTLRAEQVRQRVVTWPRYRPVGFWHSATNQKRPQYLRLNALRLNNWLHLRRARHTATATLTSAESK